MKEVKVWSPREDLRFRNMREHKLTYKQIAEVLGRTIASVHNHTVMLKVTYYKHNLHFENKKKVLININ